MGTKAKNDGEMCAYKMMPTLASGEHTTKIQRYVAHDLPLDVEGRVCSHGTYFIKEWLKLTFCKEMDMTKYNMHGWIDNSWFVPLQKLQTCSCFITLLSFGIS